jgi:hypothetical protein
MAAPILDTTGALDSFADATRTVMATGAAAHGSVAINLATTWTVVNAVLVLPSLQLKTANMPTAGTDSSVPQQRSPCHRVRGAELRNWRCLSREDGMAILTKPAWLVGWKMIKHAGIAAE